MEVVASFSQGRTAAAQCGLFTYKSVPVIFEPPCISEGCALNSVIIYSVRPNYFNILFSFFPQNVKKTGVVHNCGNLTTEIQYFQLCHTSDLPVVGFKQSRKVTLSS